MQARSKHCFKSCCSFSEQQSIQTDSYGRYVDLPRVCGHACYSLTGKPCFV